MQRRVLLPARQRAGGIPSHSSGVADPLLFGSPRIRHQSRQPIFQREYHRINDERLIAAGRLGRQQSILEQLLDGGFDIHCRHGPPQHAEITLDQHRPSRSRIQDQDVDHVIQELQNVGLEVVFGRAHIIPSQRLWPEIDKGISDLFTIELDAVTR